MVRLLRLFADEDGDSHFEDLEYRLEKSMTYFENTPPVLFSSFEPASEYGFERVPPGWVGDWHPAPQRVLAIYLSGEFEIEASDGEVRPLGPGSILLAEDTAGKGHRNPCDRRDRTGDGVPHHCPHETNAEVVGKIIYLRQNYHFGPGKISMYLHRYHDIDVSNSGVWRILKRLELNRLPASQKHKTYQKRWKRYEKPKPGHAVQVDVKFITPVGAAGKRFYQFTAIDDCTRIRVLKAYPRCNPKDRHPVPRLSPPEAAVPGRPDPNRQRRRVRIPVPRPRSRSGHQTRLHQPATPRLNGKVERSHRIDEEEFYRMLDGVVIDDTELFNHKLQEWEDFYNFNRPHGGLDGQTPYERLKAKTAESPQV